MVALYVPTPSPVLFTVTVSVEGAVPLPGLTVSHDALSCAVHANVPPPVLLMETVFADGLAPDRVAEKLKDVGLRPIAGGALTISVTGMVRGVLLAPVPLTVMVPL
jgi:hypothetical protein